MRHSKILWIATTCLLSAACTSTSLRVPVARPDLKVAKEREAAWTEITCGAVTNQVGPAVAPIVAAIVGIASDFAINFVKSVLEQAQKGRNSIFPAAGVTKNCALGMQSNSAARPAAVSITRTVIGLNGKSLSEGREGFKLDGDLEFSPISAPTKDATPQINITFTPTNLIYGQTAAPVRGKGRKHVVVLLTLSENAKLKTGASASEEQLGTVLRIDLGILQDGRKYGANILKAVQASAVMPRSESPNLNATALVFETENESLALKALSDAFGSNTDNIKKGLRDLIGIEK